MDIEILKIIILTLNAHYPVNHYPCYPPKLSRKLKIISNCVKIILFSILKSHSFYPTFALSFFLSPLSVYLSFSQLVTFLASVSPSLSPLSHTSFLVSVSMSLSNALSNAVFPCLLLSCSLSRTLS